MIDTRGHANGPATLPRGHRWVVVDVETSGLRPNAHRVLSVAALSLREDGSVEREFSTLVNADCDPGPVHIHNLTRERLADAPRFTDIAGDLADILDGGVLVAHNASFDYGFLDAEFRRAGRSIPAGQRLCTLALSRRLELDVPNFQLSTLAQHWQVQQLQAHDAYDDARVLSEVFVRSATMAESLQLPLPVVNCRSRKSVYPDSVQRVPCQWKNPGRLTEAGLVQGMKVVISGSTDTPRLTLAGRLTEAGLDVLNSASRQTSVVVCNDVAVQTAKVRKAMAEHSRHHRTAARSAAGTSGGRRAQGGDGDRRRPAAGNPGDDGDAHGGAAELGAPGQEAQVVVGASSPPAGRHPPRSGHDALPHRAARRPTVHQLHGRCHRRTRTRGADADKRMTRVNDRRLPVLTADDVNAAIEKGVVPAHMRTESRLAAPVLSQGEVIDLPAKTERWSVNIAGRPKLSETNSTSTSSRSYSTVMKESTPTTISSSTTTPLTTTAWSS